MFCVALKALRPASLMVLCKNINVDVCPQKWLLDLIRLPSSPFPSHRISWVWSTRSSQLQYQMILARQVGRSKVPLAVSVSIGTQNLYFTITFPFWSCMHLLLECSSVLCILFFYILKNDFVVIKFKKKVFFGGEGQKEKKEKSEIAILESFFCLRFNIKLYLLEGLKCWSFFDPK